MESLLSFLFFYAITFYFYIIAVEVRYSPSFGIVPCSKADKTLFISDTNEDGKWKGPENDHSEKLNISPRFFKKSDTHENVWKTFYGIIRNSKNLLFDMRKIVTF